MEPAVSECLGVGSGVFEVALENSGATDTKFSLDIIAADVLARLIYQPDKTSVCLFSRMMNNYLASKLATKRPTLPVSSRSGQKKVVAVQDVSVMPQACVNCAPGAIKAVNRCWESLSKGDPPLNAVNAFFREYLYLSGEFIVAMTMGGTM